jgi:hypothetical protein
LLRRCGIDIQMTITTSNGLTGGYTATQYSSKGRDSYSQTQVQSYRDRQGRQVIVRSKEENGNQIEDTFIENRLVQRKVNGVIEQLERTEQSVDRR